MGIGSFEIFKNNSKMDIIQVITDNPQYAKNIMAILLSGLLDKSGGSATIHLDFDKNIRLIEDGKPERKILYKI